MYLWKKLNIVLDALSKSIKSGKFQNVKISNWIFQKFVLLQKIPQRHHVDWLALFVERKDGLENFLVRREIKIGRDEQIRHAEDGVLVDEHRTEHGLLSFQILRRKLQL